MNETVNRVRIDKWLWAARFFKTRAQAGQAVSGGLVHLNGERVKPAKEIRTGDRLEITKSEDRYVLEVLALAERRGPASVARELYRESEESRQGRERRRDQRRLRVDEPGLLLPRRPNKRDRRLIHRFIRGEDA